MKILAFMFAILGLAIASFFLFYGIKGGFIDKKILKDFFNNYATNGEAIQRGVLYVIIGVVALVGSIIIFVSLYKKLYAEEKKMHHSLKSILWEIVRTVLKK